MISVGATYRDFVDQKAQSPIAVLLSQTATKDGSKAATQTVLPKVLAYRITRNEDPSSNTAQVMIADDNAEYLSTNPNGRYTQLFQPGVIDNKFSLYLGYEGANFAWPSSKTFIPYNRLILQKFTGFIETDANAHQQFMLNKTLSLIDLTKQFRFPVNDTYPHPLYGDQTLSYFDPTYNLVPINVVGGMASQWVCPGKMFTQSMSDLVYGSSHIAVAVYVDTTGGSSPASTAESPTSYSFDYANGIVTFVSAKPANSVVSVAGNPTYMAPETMISKILIELANWSPSFLSLDPSNILLPQFVANGRSVWDCIKIIASQTCPRFTPWVINADENGNLRFYESRVDGPPVKTFLQGHDLMVVGYENSARQLRTVVRADGVVYINAGGTTASDQPVVSIAYDLANIQKYGQTEPLSLSQDVVQNARPLTQTTAMSYLNQMTTAELAKVSRPKLTVNAEIWPDPTIEPGDKVAIRDTSIGMDKFFIVKQTTEEGSGKPTKHTLGLEEFYDTINYCFGTPSGVSTTLAQAAQTPPPSLPIIGAVRMGSGIHTVYPLLNGQSTTVGNGDQLIPTWYAADGNMHFDYFLNSLPQLSSTQLANPQNQWDYLHLPPGYGWSATVDPATKNTVYYGTDTSDGKTVYVGPDSVFYKFNHAPPITTGDLASYWTPPGNTAPLGVGGTQPYTGQAVNVYTWAYWYLCLDGNNGVGKYFRPIQRVNPSQDGQAISVSSTGGQWMLNNWTSPPGPTAASKYYGNVVLGTDNHTSPPPGFIGANVLGDGVLVGCAYGNTVPSGEKYVGYQKITRGRLVIFAANSVQQRQVLMIPFNLVL